MVKNYLRKAPEHFSKETTKKAFIEAGFSSLNFIENIKYQQLMLLNKK